MLNQIKLYFVGAWATIKFVLLSALLLWCVVATTTCSHKADQVKDLQTASKVANAENKAEISRLKAQAKKTETDWAQAESKAYERYAKNIQEITALHADRMRDVSGVQHSITETVKYLPDYTREALESYAKTTANGVAECSALLVGVEKVCRNYDAEIERLIFSYPEPVEKVEPHRLE